eukprot:COSAG02_NODE_48718_length_332_cov_0.330472_1_plen_66_part_01
MEAAAASARTQLVADHESELQQAKEAARLAEANERGLQAEQAESAAVAAQAQLDRREADLAAAKSA